MKLMQLFQKPATAPPVDNVQNFLLALEAIAPSAGRHSYCFAVEEKNARGYVQLIANSDREIKIHRLWTRPFGKGLGTTILHVLCLLADEHSVRMILKPLPFGDEPYPISRPQLIAWYQRHGFERGRKWMIRQPRLIADACAEMFA